MKNLEEREAHWSKGYVTKMQGTSDKFPLSCIENYEKYIENKSILEIGPGEGRELNILKPLSKQYAIADISQTALDSHKEIKNKFLITKYSENFGFQFDTIVLFYVFHHILEEELNSFIEFLMRHLNSNGYICFNIPHGFGEVGDGIVTTKYELKSFSQNIRDHNLDIIHSNIEKKQMKRLSYQMFVVQKKEEFV